MAMSLDFASSSSSFRAYSTGALLCPQYVTIPLE